MSIDVYENALAIQDFSTISAAVFNSELPWYYSPHSAYHTEPVSTAQHTGSFGHLLYAEEDGSANSTEFERYILEVLKSQIPGVNNILRVRLGMHVPSGGISTINAAHIDRETPHKVALLYLNNSDGDTLIYTEKYDFNSSLSSFEYRREKLPRDLTVEARVTPSSNKLIIFEGSTYHSSMPPIKGLEIRATININFN
jgi:hypothetical protein